MLTFTPSLLLLSPPHTSSGSNMECGRMVVVIGIVTHKDCARPSWWDQPRDTEQMPKLQFSLKTKKKKKLFFHFLLFCTFSLSLFFFILSFLYLSFPDLSCSSLFPFPFSLSSPLLSSLPLPFLPLLSSSNCYIGTLILDIAAIWSRDGSFLLPPLSNVIGQA